MFDNLEGEYDLHGGLQDGPVPIWLLHEPDENSQCPGLARFVNAHFAMLGLGSGDIRYCRAEPDGTYEAETDIRDSDVREIVPGEGHPDPTTHNHDCTYELLVMIDGDDERNNFEAACLFDGYFYALGVGRDFTTAKEVVKAAFGDNIEWQYATGKEGSYIFHECTEDPWVEKP